MRRVLPLLLILLLPLPSFAQFYGAAGLGITSSSNVSGLDSSIPDQTIDPNLILGYDWNPGHRFRLGFSVGASGSNYQQHSERSSTNIFAGITPTYYLLSNSTFFATVTNKDTSNAESSAEVGSVSERLLKLENWLITVRPKLPKLKGTIDSSQELIGVTRELLATTAYTTSVKEIVLSELKDQLVRIEAHHSRELANITKEWKALIAKLESIEEESDFLPTDELDLESEDPETTDAESTSDLRLAPLMTMSTTHQRFRNMSASDFYMLKDRGMLTERSIATSFSLPITWSRQTNTTTYENYTNDQLWTSLRVSGMPTDKLQLAGSIDRIGTDHPYDTSYTNTQWRGRASGKLQITDASLIGAEFGYAARTYAHPLSIALDNGPGKPRSFVTVGSEFSQYNLGAWFEHFLTEKIVVGGILSASISPSLKAYVNSINTTPGEFGQPPDRSVGVADEEFNYDMFSIAGFVNSNLIEEIETTLDIAFQSRSYGAVDLGTVRSKAGNQQIQQLIASASDAERTESWVTASLGASRLFLFDDRLFSLISGFGLDASITYTGVTASVSTYSNDNTSVALSVAAYF